MELNRYDGVFGRVLMVLGFFGGTAQAHPVSIVKNLKNLAAPIDSQVLYSKGDTAVVKASSATKLDFQDLYVLDASMMFALPEEIETAGELLGFEPGRFAVMRLSDSKLQDVAALVHSSGIACGGLLKLNGDVPAAKMAGTPAPVLPVEQRDPRVQQAVAIINKDNIRATIEELSSLQTRHHQSPSGQDVAQLLAQKYDALRGNRSDVTITTYDHGSATPQNSLVVRIQGKTRPNEVIVLGSHIDSISFLGGRAPGADDNASGTATNLEIFRVLMEEGYQPARTLEIHGYAAEEIGLVGSQDIATDYKNAGVNVVAMVQHDMTMWKAPNSPDKIWFVTSNTDAGFNDLLTKLVDSYVGMPWGKAALYGGTSDHQSWRRAGFAAAFPFENPSSYNRAIHTPNDTVNNVQSFELPAGFAKLGVAYVMHFGGVE